MSMEIPAGARWRTSSHTAEGSSCVSVTDQQSFWGLRDDTHECRAVFVTPATSWQAFIRMVVDLHRNGG